MIRNEKISQGHAKILIGLENAYLIAEKIVKKKLSVRQTESLVKILKNGIKRNISNFLIKSFMFKVKPNQIIF